MDLGVISSRYAKALLKSATEAGVESQVYDDMQLLYHSYLDVQQLRFTIDNPMLSKDTKQSLLATACGGNPVELTRRFFALVLREDRENALQLMAARTSRFTANRRISFRESSPLPCPLLRRWSRRCGRWWRKELTATWSST